MSRLSKTCRTGWLVKKKHQISTPTEETTLSSPCSKHRRRVQWRFCLCQDDEVFSPSETLPSTSGCSGGPHGNVPNPTKKFSASNNKNVKTTMYYVRRRKIQYCGTNYGVYALYSCEPEGQGLGGRGGRERGYRKCAQLPGAVGAAGAGGVPRWRSEAGICCEHYQSGGRPH